MNRINWGIIGCGDVTERKSGPAFNKVPDSALIAVMRRNADLAAGYARRHGVPHWYSDAGKLINDPGINAIYVATPPSSHEEYAMAAIAAGKPVYVEKPMSLNYGSAKRMADAAAANDVKLSVAHYRRGWPLFNKIKEMLHDGTIGTVRSVEIAFDRLPLTAEELADVKKAWRVDPAISGGGLFHDLAPHQLDILYWLFGDAKEIEGTSKNTGGHYAADDTVKGHILFANGIEFSGKWDFNAAGHRDHCGISGSNGRIRFSFFSSTDVELTVNERISILHFDPLEHVQQPMIGKVVQYFLGKGINPCTGAEGAEVMRWIDRFKK